MPKPSSGSSLRSRSPCSRSFGLAVGIRVTTAGPPERRARHRSRGRHGLAETTTEPGPSRQPEPVGRQPLLADVRRRSAALARAPRCHARPPRAEAPLDARTRELHRVPARLLRGRALCQHLPRHDLCDRRGDGQDPLAATVGGTLPSSPAIDGPRVLVASQDGTVTALSRRSGRRLWQVRTAGKVESSPVVVDGTAYFGSHDGRLFAVRSDTGRIRWAYQTGGRINASPSVFGGACASRPTPARSSASTAAPGRERWTTYLKRDAFRYESFYASPSTRRRAALLGRALRQGRRRSTPRAGASCGRRESVGSATRLLPSRTDACSRAASTGACARSARRTGDELWSTWVGGRILGAPVVIGPYVFFSTLEKRHVCAPRRPTERSSGASRWAATRRASRPSGRTSSR